MPTTTQNQFRDLAEVPAVSEFFNATIYFKSDILGISNVDCRSVKVEILPYAQYDRALKLTYVPKGKRNERSQWITFRPFLVVVPTTSAVAVNNWNAPEQGSTPGVTITKSRYGSCDPRWITDFTSNLGDTPVLLHIESEQ